MKKRSRVTWRRMRLHLFILAWERKNARSMNWSAPTSVATLITFSWLGSIQCLTICADIRVSTRSCKKLSAENSKDRQFFRVKAAQWLQDRSHVRGCRLAADSSSVNSLSHIRSAGLGNEDVCAGQLATRRVLP